MRVQVSTATEPYNDFSLAHAPVAGTKATITKPAGGERARNVCTGLTATIAASAVAPSATTVTLALIDGPSGGTTYLWGPITLGIAAVAGALNGITRTMWRQGSPNTEMTLEFSAGIASALESVALEGYLTP